MELINPLAPMIWKEDQAWHKSSLIILNFTHSAVQQKIEFCFFKEEMWCGQFFGFIEFHFWPKATLFCQHGSQTILGIFHIPRRHDELPCFSSFVTSLWSVPADFWDIPLKVKKYNPRSQTLLSPLRVKISLLSPQKNIVLFPIKFTLRDKKRNSKHPRIPE